MELQDQYELPTAQPFSTPMSQFGSSIIQLTDTQEEIYRLELALRNQVMDKEGNLVRVGEPLINEPGVNSVIGQVQSILNRVAIMSNFEKKDIPMLVDFMGDTLAKDLMLNRVTYGIKNTSARDKIYMMVLNLTYCSLKRALNNGERGFWKGSQQDIRQYVESGKQSKGLMGLFNWGK